MRAGSNNPSAKSLVLASITIPQQVIVPDISFYQETADFNQMKANGARGVIIRAGQNLWRDPKFDTFWPAAKAAGLPRGTYWFYDSRVPPNDQADLYFSQFKNDWPEMEIVADYEENYDGPFSGWQNLKTFINRLVSLGVPGKQIAIYTGYYYWGDHGSTDPYFKQFPLWLAWYTTNPANVSIPAPWDNNDLFLWQYTSAGDGHGYGVGSNGIDLSWFNGTQVDFDIRYQTDGGGPVEPPPDNGGEMTETVFPSGVKIIEGDLNNAHVRTLIVPNSAILSAQYLYTPGTCKHAEDLNGYDFVANFTPFNINTCKLSIYGLRTGGQEYLPCNPDAQPYLILDGPVAINHVVKSFKNYREVSQGFRYVIQDGVKNIRANDDWNTRDPRRLVGILANGDLAVITVKPLSYPGGWTLHECADYGLQLRCYDMFDGDSGRSTQDYILVDGQKQLLVGADAYHDPVAVLFGIKLKEALSTGTTPPPEPPPTGTTFITPAGTFPIEERDTNGNLVATLHNRDDVVWE